MSRPWALGTDEATPQRGRGQVGGDELVTSVERQLAAAQAIAHIGSWEWNATTNAVVWSDELYRIYGFEPQSRGVTLEFFLSCVHPGDRERVQHEVQAALEAGGRFSYAERVVRPDGSVRELDTVGEAIRDARGQVTGLLGTCRDVTEQRARDEQLRLYADVVAFASTGLVVWDVGDAQDVGQIRLVAFNPAAERAARIPLADRVGQPLLEILPYAEGGQLPALLLGVARDRRVREATVERSRDPANAERAVALRAFPLPGGRVGLAVEDITQAVAARRLRDAEHRVLEMIASGAPLREVLEALVLAIEDQAPGTLGSVLRLDGDRIRHGAAPHLPAAFTHAIDGQPIGPSAGSCGTAAFRGQPVYVDDIASNPLWAPYREVALAHGLRACWSTPILANDRAVLGTFALYYREPRAPTPADEELVARATHLARIAIERAEVEDQLRELSARVESAREDERSGIAREIHDELGQALTALKMDLAWLGRRIAGVAPAPASALLEKLQAMSAMTDETIQRVRRISSDLRPGALDDLGLVAALEWQGQEFEKRTGTACAVGSNVADAHFARDLSTGVFRVAQEALTNVARHAGARRVAIRLDRVGDRLRLEVTDDGSGITAEALRSPRALGLLGMRERARRLHGQATIGPAPGGGTVVSLDVPLSTQQGRGT